MLIPLHPSFKINGQPILEDDIREVANRFIANGEDYQKSIGNFLLNWIDQSKEIKVKTSGSTGVPKTISLQKEHMKNSANATGNFFGLVPGNTCLLCLSCDYIAGKMMMVRAMVLGLDIYIVEPNSRPLQGISKSLKFDFCAMVPMQVQDSINQISRIKKLVIGGAPISSILRNQLFRVETKIYETYGMTETITHVALKEIKKVSGDENFKALPNVEFSQDERGCLVIKAPKVTKEVILTNDLVKLVSDQEFLWLGRYDNVVNSGGIKLFPEEIENKLNKIINEPFIIAGVADEVFGQKLILLIEANQLFEVNALNGYMKDHLKPYERPKEIIFLDKFIRTDTGKIQRNLTLQKATTN